MHCRHQQRKRASRSAHLAHLIHNLFWQARQAGDTTPEHQKGLDSFLRVSFFSVLFVFPVFPPCNLNLSRFMTCMYVSVCLCSYRRKACEVCCPVLCTLQKTLCLSLPPLGNVISRTGSTSYHILVAHGFRRIH